MTSDGWPAANRDAQTLTTADSRVSSQAAVYLVGTVGAAAIQFVAIPIFTRSLGPEAFGELGLVLTVTSLLLSLMGLGSDMVLGRYWFESPDPSARRALAAQWIVLLMLWSVVVIGVASLLVVLGSATIDTAPGLTTALLIGIVALLPQLLATMLAQVLRNEFRPWSFSITNVAQAFLRALFGVALVLILHLGVVGVLLGMLVADLVIALIRLGMVHLPWRLHVDVSAMKPLLRFGLPFVPGGLAFWAYNGLDRLVLAGNVPVGTVGAYIAATALVAPFTIIMTAVGQAWLPFLTNLYTSSAEKAAQLIATGIEVALLGYGVLCLLTGVFGETLIVLIAGEGYRSGAVALPLLALGYAFWGLSLFAASGSTMAKKSALIPVISFVSVIAELGMLLVLVPRFGMIGASGAVAIGYLLMSVGFLLYSQATFPVPFAWGPLGVELLVLVAMAASLSVLPHTAALIAVASAISLLMGARLLVVVTRRQAIKS